MKISVITVSFNAASVLETCIQSVKEQTYDNFEHLLIDGGSNDNTQELISHYSSYFSVCISEPDNGIYDAMNKGIKNARGDIIGFINADDFYVHHKVFESVANCFKDNPDIDACYSDLKYVGKLDTSHTERFWKSNQFEPGLFSKGWCPPHPTLFVRRSVYERFGVFDLSYHIAADAELMMRFLEVKRIRVKYIPDVWIKMRIGGISNKNYHNIWLQNQEVLRALTSYKLPSNPLFFFANKLWIRSKQFLGRRSS